MNNGTINDYREGVRQAGVRAHNERLVLSVIQRLGALPSAEVAKITGLSAQTASVITRALEADGLLLKGEPQRGRVGKPSVPMALNPDGALSVGLRIGRRSANLILMDITGRERGHVDITYPFPTPQTVMGFACDGLDQLLAPLSKKMRARVSGIGVAAPFQLWNWLGVVNAPKEEMTAWRDFSFEESFAEVTDLPIQVGNDGTVACNAEHLLGQGKRLSDYAYIFIGSFAGGGVVLNSRVFPGPTGNAGSFGSLPVRDTREKGHQLIQNASIYLLERHLKEAGQQVSGLWLDEADWHGLGLVLEDWIKETARHLATACVSITAVIDFQAVVIDGAFPAEIRSRICALVREELLTIDTQGIIEPLVLEGSIGRKAGAFGAAYQPLLSRYFLSSAPSNS